MFLWLNDQNSMYLKTYASNLTSNKMHVLNCRVIMIFREIENISSYIMIIYMIVFFDNFVESIISKNSKCQFYFEGKKHYCLCFIKYMTLCRKLEVIKLSATHAALNDESYFAFITI